MPPMKLNKKLNLVIPVDDTSHGTIYIHSTPIALSIFEAYFEVLSAAHTAIFREGYQSAILSGSRVAAMHLRKCADRLQMRQEVDGGLMPEIERLTNVIALENGKGWITHPYYEAKAWLDDEDRSQVENAIAFFIVNSAVTPKRDLPDILGRIAPLWGAQSTSSTCTEFAGSLPTSTPAETLPEKVA